MFVLKCSECGNTFKIERLKDGELVACPVCESEYKVLLEEGKVKLVAFVYENEDFGEL